MTIRSLRIPSVAVSAAALAAAVLSCACPIPLGAAQLRLRAGTVDTSVTAPVTLAAAADAYRVVQFGHSLTQADKKAVQDTGAKILSYLPDNAYLVCADANTARRLQQLAGVCWVGAMQPGWRVSPDIPRKAQDVRLDVTLFPGENSARVASAFKDRGARVESVADSPRGAVLRVRAKGSAAAAIGAVPGVRWVEPRFEPHPTNDVARTLTNVTYAWSPTGLFGEGQTVAVCDTGLDTGATSSTLSADFQGRVTAAYGLGRPPLTNDPAGHGTHVAGTVLGNGILSGSNPSAHNYLTSFAGAAPEARLVMQCIMDSGGGLGGLPDDLNNLFDQAYTAGARIHTNSWGANTQGAYNLASKQVDEYVWNHPDMLVVFSAGNDGVDSNSDGVVDLGTINTPSTAKNCIAVGATESQRSTGGLQITWSAGSWASKFPADPIRSDMISDDPGGMAAFSSRGPCADGRTKPDICAPGTNIISCRSHDPSAGTEWGAYSQDYAYSGGTSMSTPLVAGAAALIRQSLTQKLGQEPSAALVKALCLASAKELTPGQYGTGPQLEVAPRPNSVEGWGLLDIKQALSDEAPLTTQTIDERGGLYTGGQRTYAFSVTNTSIPLHVMLVWMDYPGDPAASQALVNDLDLQVQAPDGTIYNGNGALDRVNNVEGVDIPTPAQGDYRVTVSGYNIPEGPQPFALVAQGGLPRAYVSGYITSAAGSAVPGVTVTAASSTESHQAGSGPDGHYTILVPTGTYTVTPALAGWTFNPTSRTETVTGTGLDDVSFQATATPAQVSGTVYLWTDQTQQQTYESPHPYPTNQTLTTTITAPSGAIRVRVHFARLATESSYDFVHVKSEAGAVLATYSGKHDDVWSPWVDGSTVIIALVSDQSNTDYGWQIDRYEYTQAGAPLTGVSVADARSGKTVTTGQSGQYTLDGLEPLSTTITPSLTNYIFKPASLSVSPAPGQSLTGQDFVAVPEPPVVHVDITHEHVGDLDVIVGVGTPEHPLWSQLVSTRDGGSGTLLHLDVATDDARQYFPPTNATRWFVQACDEVEYDTGSFTAFSVSRGGWTWHATQVPLAIPDAQCATLYIPSRTADSIVDVKSAYDGTPALLWGKVVSAKFSDRIYVQDQPPAAGICVLTTAKVKEGDMVTITGVTASSQTGCDKMVDGAQVYVNNAAQAPPRPLHTLCRSIGGKAPAAGATGFSGSTDLNNMGLLMAVSGRITKTGPSWFYVSDGSPTNDPDGYPGLRIISDGIAVPDPGGVVTVSGISTCYSGTNGTGPALLPRRVADIQAVVTPVPLFSDGFESGAGQWQPVTGADPMVVVNGRYHTGMHSFLSAGETQSIASHTLQGLSSDNMTLSAWFYDDGSAPPCAQQLQLQSDGTDGKQKDRFAIGVYSPASAAHYSVYTAHDGWQATSLARSVGWHQLAIQVYEYYGKPGDVRFRVDGMEVLSGQRATSATPTTILLGNIDGPYGADGYFDDVLLTYGS